MQELIIDLKDCDATRFTKHSVEAFFRDVCVLLKAGCVQSSVDDALPKSNIRAIQFTTKGSITIHALHHSREAFINVLSPLEPGVSEFCRKWFWAKECNFREIMRG